MICLLLSEWRPLTTESFHSNVTQPVIVFVIGTLWAAEEIFAYFKVMKMFYVFFLITLTFSSIIRPKPMCAM